MQGNHSKDEYFWTNYMEDGGHRAWSGYAFEQVCMRHIPQIKAKLGISGVSTNVASWRSHTFSQDAQGKDVRPGSSRLHESNRGAQIDMLIDRRDGVINICEMKYSKNPFAIDSKYDEVLRNKKAVFAMETGTKSALHITMVTTYGVKPGAYFGAVQSEVIMDDLFA
jgi:hypothetical protein